MNEPLIMAWTVMPFSVVAKAWTDSTFKSALLSNPNDVLRSALWQLPWILPSPIEYTCIATMGGKEELIDTWGNVFNCLELPFVRKLEKYGLGTISSRYLVEKIQFSNWYEMVANQEINSNCKNCTMFPLCGGWCPKHWLDGRAIPCPSFKINLSERLFLFYSAYIAVEYFRLHING